jgi:hypothetical protein
MRPSLERQRNTRSEKKPIIGPLPFVSMTYRLAYRSGGTSTAVKVMNRIAIQVYVIVEAINVNYASFSISHCRQLRKYFYNGY